VGRGRVQYRGSRTLSVAECADQRVERIRWPRRLPAQIEIELSVGEAAGQPVSDVDCQGRLADTREPGVGERFDLPDDALAKAGVRFGSRQEVFAAPLLLKYKPFSPDEISACSPGQILGAVFHAEGRSDLLGPLLNSRVRAYSYEFLQENGQFPLMRAGGTIAGIQSIFHAAHALQTYRGGRGVLLAKIPGCPPPKVTVIGSGNVGLAAADTAAILGADAAQPDDQREQQGQLVRDHPGEVDRRRGRPSDVDRQAAPSFRGGDDVLTQVGDQGGGRFVLRGAGRDHVDHRQPGRGGGPLDGHGDDPGGGPHRGDQGVEDRCVAGIYWEGDCSGVTCKDKHSPTFFSTKRLATITT
jgi:hypothetical protein